jgi:hypothetical protein
MLPVRATDLWGTEHDDDSEIQEEHVRD